MGKLEKDGAPPAREEDNLAVEPPGDAPRSLLAGRHDAGSRRSLLHDKTIIAPGPRWGNFDPAAPLAISRHRGYGVSWAGT